LIDAPQFAKQGNRPGLSPGGGAGGDRLRDQITYDNVWVLRVDGAARRMASYVAAPLAIAALALSMTGGVTLYNLAGALSLPPAPDRALQYVCVEGPLYIVALAALIYEHRARMAANAQPLTAMALGGALGLAGFGIAVGVAALFGAVRAGSAPPAPLAHGVEGAAIGAVLITFQALGEEVFFRAWLQPVLAARWGPWIGVAATSILFGAAHTIGRPIGVVAFLNDSLAGLVFGLIAFRSGGLWAPFAAHFAWNWTEQCLLGLTPNPGVDPLGSLFDLDLVGPGWVTGGSDEMNGTLGAMLALLIMAALTLTWRARGDLKTTAL
jgi:membrane protease YdiL (CAAX protease family)